MFQDYEHCRIVASVVDSLLRALCLQRFVRAIERFCFGENGELHGTRAMNRTQRQACLAVGTLAKNLANSGDERLANQLTNRLETWLDEHEKGRRKLSSDRLSPSSLKFGIIVHINLTRFFVDWGEVVGTHVMLFENAQTRKSKLTATNRTADNY